jgi:hypothetical protein
MMHPVPVPADSRVQPSLPTAYFFDAYELAVENDGRTALDLYLELVAGTPAWIEFLMGLRNRIVTLFGLKNIGGLRNVEASKNAYRYKVGDRAGIFSILSLSDQEVVLVDNDKHLNAQVSVYKHAGEPQKVVVTTVVHVHNFLGRAYLFFVVPAHKIIVPMMLAQLAKINSKINNQ